LVFVDANEDLVMANDVVTPLNPLIAPIEEEELEETPLDVNVSQRSHDEKLFKRVPCIQVDRSAWDHQFSPNPHVLVIYLENFPSCGIMLNFFEECQCEDDDVCLHYRTCTTRNFGFCNCCLQLKFSCMRHMQLQICVVA
jgi:hypothetical protein